MARVTRDGRTYHPDELDRRTGEPLEVAEAPAAPPSPTELLKAAGATVAGNWWTLPVADAEGNPIKLQGAAKALEALRAAEAAGEIGAGVAPTPSG